MKITKMKMSTKKKTMTKRVHPAQSARQLVGVASGVALVGIVTGFQFSANAEEKAQEVLSSTSSPSPVALDPATGQPTAPEAAPEAVPAPADPGTLNADTTTQVAPPAQAPAAPAPAEAPAPVVVAPAAPAPVAPAPAAPVNGTTAGSGG